MNEYTGNFPQQGGTEPGKGAAIGSLVCGILSVVFVLVSFFIAALVCSLISIIAGIVGLVLAASAKKAGFNGGLQTAGLVLSIIGLVLGAITFVSCVACIGCLSCGSSNLIASTVLASL